MKHLVAVVLFLLCSCASKDSQTDDKVILDYLNMEYGQHSQLLAHPYFLSIDTKYLLDSLSEHSKEDRINRSSMSSCVNHTVGAKPALEDILLSDTSDRRVLLSDRCGRYKAAALISAMENKVYFEGQNFTYSASGAEEYLFIFEDNKSIRIDTVLKSVVVVNIIGQ